MNLEFSEKAEELYGKHQEAAVAIVSRKQLRDESIRELNRAQRAKYDADNKYDRLFWTNLYIMKENAGIDRRIASENFWRVDSKHRNAVVDVELAYKNYDKNLSNAREHYQQNQDLYHEQALQEARAAGKDINFQGVVAQNVRIVPQKQQDVA